MRKLIPILPALALAAGCATSTYALNPQLASQAGLADDGSTGVSFTEPADGALATFLQRGSCSWYGPRFHGRRTSSGEVFDKFAMTAAHRTLPFGSEVEVTDVDSGNKVRVRINDRGPFSHGRILDLSYAAASSLGIVGKGIADIQIRVVGQSALPVDDAFALQVASFSSRQEAERFVEGLNPGQRAAGMYYVKAPDGETADFTVRFGPFDSEENAKKAATRLQRAGLAPSLLSEDLTRAN